LVARERKTAVTALIATIVTLMVTAGCGVNRRYANNCIQQLPHTDVSIDYEWSKPAADVQQSSSEPAESGKQLLRVVYPHPSPKYGRKYAEVTLRREPSAADAAVANAVGQLVTNPFKKQESLATGNDGDRVQRLPIPREELEFLLRDLIADSYFDREARVGDVRLDVTLGSRSTHKTWDRVASFDQLARRVAEENALRSAPRSRSGSAAPVVPASAELLPPSSAELLDEPSADSAARRGSRSGAGF
jgi:hypothetical protein